MTEQPTTPPRTPKPPAVVWSDVVRRIENREPIPPLPGETALHPLAPRTLPLRSGPLTAVPSMDVDEDGLPASLPAQPYGAGGRTPPTPAELREIADDLNRHGGLDETFVAALLQTAAASEPEPTTVKFTQAQIDAFPTARRFSAPSSEPQHFFGAPVELVETVEESTPYQLANAHPGGIVEIRGGITDDEYALRARWKRAHGPDRPHPQFLKAPEVHRPWWRRTLDRVRRWRA